jgi:hypothetical protein
MTDANEFGEEVPECVCILGRPPIDIRFMKDEDLYQEFRTRIAALLEANMVVVVREERRSSGLKDC